MSVATKKAATIRIHQLAKEIGVDSKDIVAKCKAEDIPDIKDHMSVVKAGLAATIREWFSESHGGGTAVETAAAVDVTRAKQRARKRTPKKAAGDATPDFAETLSDDDTITPSAQAVETAPAEVEERREKKVARATTAKAAKIKAAPAESEPTEAPAPFAMPQAPHIAAAAAAPAAPEAPPQRPHAPSAPPVPPTPVPVMNVPTRPTVVSPAGPRLSAPTKTKMAGPKVIRVETPDVIPAPRARTAPRQPAPTRGGPRTGRGIGAPVDMPESPGNRGGGAPRRNKRRSALASEETGRSARSGHSAFADGDDRSFNWREQDLLERENRLNRAGGFFKQARRDNLKRQTGGGHRAVMPAESGGKVKVQVPITVKELSALTGVKVPDILRKLLLGGKMVNINTFLDAETAIEATIDYNIELDIEQQRTADQKIAQQFRDRTATDERRRHPVVTILGHVDHGKTSLLDKIRNANVAAGEAGGITQATSAFQVPARIGDAEHLITFIDTPGHEAFTEMRARGAKVTDVVVLVVAADDGVMPQTVESINHAKAAGVPIVVALNKIDKPEATDKNIQRILGELAQHQLNPVEWGGTTEIVRTSATKGTGVQDLLEVLDYQAQLLDLKADYGGEAEGTVLEAKVAEGRGPVANIIVQQGILKKGDHVVVGRAFGRVRDIINDRGERIEEAMPSMPVAFSGINDIPDAGDKFYIVKSLKEAEAAAGERIAQDRQRDLSKEKVTLDNIFKHLEAAGSDRKELPLIVKADVQGSVETLRTVLSKISGEHVSVAVKHAAVGGINESDVTLAEATGAIIVGFNVTSSAAARKGAEAKGVDIRFYDVIYDLTDDVKRAAEGLLDPEVKLEVLGHAEVRDVFKISRVGMIAGCYVTDGAIERNSQIRVTRGGIVIEKDRRLESLKRFKDDVKEVRAGQECGMSIEGYSDIKSGDVLECYRTREVKRKL